MVVVGVVVVVVVVVIVVRVYEVGFLFRGVDGGGLDCNASSGFVTMIIPPIICFD